MWSARLAVLGMVLGGSLAASAEGQEPSPAPAPAAAPSGPTVIRIGSLAPPDTPWIDDLELFKKNIIEATHGQMKPKIVMATANRTSEADIVRAAQKGDEFQFIGVSSASLVDHIPALEVLELPFLFESAEEADFVLDNFLAEPVRQLMRPKGLEFFTWCENGWLNIGSKDRALRTPHDLVGMRVRSQPSSMHILAWQTFGATPVPLALNETLDALRAGQVSGFAQTTLLTLALGWAKEIKTYSVLHHIYQPLVIAYSKKFFDAQTAANRAILLAHPEIYSASDRRGVRALEGQLLDQVKNMGIKVNVLTQKERESFIASAHRIQDKFVNTAPPEALALLHVIMQGKAAYAKHK